MLINKLGKNLSYHSYTHFLNIFTFYVFVLLAGCFVKLIVILETASKKDNTDSYRERHRQPETTAKYGRYAA